MSVLSALRESHFASLGLKPLTAEQLQQMDTKLKDRYAKARKEADASLNDLEAKIKDTPPALQSLLARSATPLVELIGEAQSLLTKGETKAAVDKIETHKSVHKAHATAIKNLMAGHDEYQRELKKAAERLAKLKAPVTTTPLQEII